MRGAIPALPNMASCRGAQLKVQHRDNFTFTFSFTIDFIMNVILIC